MAVIETWYNQDLQQPVKVHYLDGSMFSHNGNGNRIGVHVFNNDEPVTLSGTVSGYVVTSDGSTVPCTGTRSGNNASILIPAAAYQPGAVFITIFLTDGSTVTTIASVATNVLTARTGNQVSPGSVVTDWTQTINTAMQAVVDANAANMAVPYESLTYPVPLGKYTLHDNLLYRCIFPIASSEAWTASHWTRVKLGDDITDLKNASAKLNTQSSIISGDIYGFAPVTEQKSIRGITINGSGKLLELNGTATSGIMISLTGSQIRAINNSSPSEAMLADTIPVIAGHKYRLSANVVRGNCSGKILYRAYDVSGNGMGDSQLGCGIDFVPADNEIGCAAIFVHKEASLDNALIEFHLTDITNGVNWEPVNFEFYEGYLNYDGSIIAPTAASRQEKYTNRIKTKPGELFEIKYTVGSDGGWAAYVCYDQNGAVIGERQTLAAAGQYTKYDGIFTIPVDCYEIAFCFRSYGLLGIFSAWRNININDMYVDIINIKDDISALQNSGTHVANAFDAYGIKSINHAGYGTLAQGYPDNTIPVFLLSKQHGFPIVETDLRLTSDGVPVLLHDASINRTARNADGSAIEGTVNIASITYEQALQYDFGIAAGAKWAGTKIPSLAEFLRMCMENDLLAYVEIEHTDTMTPAKIAEIIKMTRDAGMLRRVTWIAMNPVDLRNVLLADNAARVGWVLNERITSAHEATYKSLITPYNEAFIDCRHGFFSPAGPLTEEGIEAEVSLLKSWGCALEVWAPDQAQQIRNVHNYCTGYTSNFYNADIVLRKAVQDTLYLESPNGTIYKVTVTNEGTLSVST